VRLSHRPRVLTHPGRRRSARGAAALPATSAPSLSPNSQPQRHMRGSKPPSGLLARSEVLQRDGRQARQLRFYARRQEDPSPRRSSTAALDIVTEKTSAARRGLEEALKNVHAAGFEVKSKRVGGANYQIPIRSARAPSLAGLPLAHRGRQHRKGQPMAEKLGSEIYMASQNEGDGLCASQRRAPHWPIGENRAFRPLRSLKSRCIRLLGFFLAERSSY